jgi:hypothetical protein
MAVDDRKQPSRKNANVIVFAYSDSLPQQADARTLIALLRSQGRGRSVTRTVRTS